MISKFLLVLLSAVFCAVNAPAQQFTLAELVENALENSPIILKAQKDSDTASAAKEVVDSYHLPVLNLTQKLQRSNNPVGVFSYKLMQEDFAASDFNIKSLNNPDLRTNNQSSITFMLPIYAGGQVAMQSKSIADKVESADLKTVWIKKEVRRAVYALYYSYIYLGELEDFLAAEKRYLEDILSTYEAKTAENKNRFLSYNQGRIIYETINEGLGEIAAQKNTAIASLEYITGLSGISIAGKSTDVFEEENWKSFKSGSPLNREDLSALKKYVDSIQKEASANRRSYIPRLDGFANYSVNTEEFRSYGKDYTGGLALGWDFGISTVKAVKLAEARLLSAEAEYFSALNSAKEEVSRQKNDLLNYEQKISARENMHKLYSENKKILTSQYQKGSIDLYNLLDNFAHYLRNKSELAGIKAEYKMKIAAYLNNYTKIGRAGE